MAKDKSTPMERPAAHPVGFSESQAAFETALARVPAHTADATAEPVGKLTLGSGGRLVVPADVRAKLGLQEGDAMLASLVDGELRLVPVATAVHRAQLFVQATVRPSNGSVVDEFLRDRYEEQLREEMN